MITVKASIEEGMYCYLCENEIKEGEHISITYDYDTVTQMCHYNGECPGRKPFHMPTPP